MPETQADYQPPPSAAAAATAAPHGPVLAMLDEMNADELAGLIRAAEGKRREKLDAAKRELVAEFRARASSLGVPLEELFPQAEKAAQQGTARQGRRKQRSDAGRKLAPHYRGPNGEEWTGRGRPPTWLTTLEAQGRRREEFAMKGDESKITK